jgi:hypothetical protein
VNNGDFVAGVAFIHLADILHLPFKQISSFTSMASYHSRSHKVLRDKKTKKNPVQIDFFF